MAPWLSARMVTVLTGRLCKSLMSLRSHSASFVAAAAAMYSASVVDAATVCWRLLDQVMAPPFMMKT